MACAVAAFGSCRQSALELHPVFRVREQGFATPHFPGGKALLALAGTWLVHRKGTVLSPPRHVARAIPTVPAIPVAVAVGGAVLVAAAVSVTSRAKPTEPREPRTVRDDVEDLGAQRSEELRSMLPTSLEEALKDFEGDFSGPWRALGLEACDPSVTEDDIRMAYRKAVRLEHPDTSEKPDAEERFQRIRKAYALLSDEGSRELLLEAIEQEASCFAELSGFDSELEAEEEGKEKSSFPWCLVLLVAVLAVLFLAVAVSLSSPDMQLRPVPKEPAVYSLEADLKR